MKPFKCSVINVIFLDTKIPQHPKILWCQKTIVHTGNTVCCVVPRGGSYRERRVCSFKLKKIHTFYGLKGSVPSTSRTHLVPSGKYILVFLGHLNTITFTLHSSLSEPAVSYIILVQFVQLLPFLCEIECGAITYT